ncbi:hypothetical protein FDB55_00205 [Clostridium botulinum]|uniref:Uncharacterized protein n=3 Tax=Clostridium botulinum TaxID=1491 RepID=A0A0C2SJJ9_CLOBO|nr:MULTISPECIES: hypothetical protein [Clostridium]ACD53304.1 conserved hypothetical protein [Clostridium botulinum E3 str. Alaska E43]AJF29122.1 hypothetical protein ST13_05310 [Clostridium botulinum]AJF32183.1 hypothetical protein ST12_05310 [Clostridium botulinum]ALT05477.1 hypothetical protein [Clostridium botulinum]ALT05575.1 hypothetical protein [Clostridium botulinum]
MGKAGRKENCNISDNDMLVALERYTREFPNEKINIKKLADFSGIERHYWYSRKGLREKIEEINSISYEKYDIISDGDRKKIKFPNVDEVVDNNFRNKKRLKFILNSFFLTYQDFYESSCEAYKLKKDINILKDKIIKYEDEIQKLKNERDKFRELSNYNENKYYEIAIRSRERNFRKENNIKSNVIEINNKNIKAYSTDEDDLDSLLNRIDD